MAHRTIRYEQAVYGSFPFWDRGYNLLAKSDGCRAEWIDGFRSVCRRFGERPPGVDDASGLLALRLEQGPWLIVGVSPLGRDDAGRPGALAFHGLFVEPGEYRKVRFNPFLFDPCLRGDWSSSSIDSVLPGGRLLVPGAGLWGVVRRILKGGAPETDLELIQAAVEIVDKLSRRERVVVPSDRPILELARKVWSRLPARSRRRISMATWAFDNANGFDLVAIPRGRATANPAFSSAVTSLILADSGVDG